jgi:hypothetical protein
MALLSTTMEGWFREDGMQRPEYSIVENPV